MTPPQDEVRTLLTEARRTASLARTALKGRQDAAPHFRAALDAREKATALDPGYLDPAWAEDLVSHPIIINGAPVRSVKRDKRLTDVLLATQQNADLLDYFRLQLGITANPVTISSQLEDVQAPSAWQPLTDGVTTCATCGHDSGNHDTGVGRCHVGVGFQHACQCVGYVAAACRHRWMTKLLRRQCADCGATEQLLPTKAVEDTLAFQQVAREAKGKA